MTAQPIHFPSVLAGPILRRVETERVIVWLASSEPLHLELRIEDGNGVQLGSSQACDSPIAQPMSAAPARQQTVLLGKSLFIHLLEAQPSCIGQTFPLDTLLFYRLYDFSYQAEFDLSPLALDGCTLPSFYIPSTLTVIAYGSCRKAHGLSISDEGIPQTTDALALLAQQLTQYPHDFSQRPSHLFLIGDQIYADDVLAPLMRYIQQAAAQLIDYVSILPDAEFANDDLSQLALMRRKQIASQLGFTTIAKNAHVLSFGEYAILYLIALGNRLGFEFTPDLSNADEVSLQGFLDSQADIRKVLANMPTYMSFDDHDITDDWNLNRSWYDQVRSSVSGTRVIAHALTAAWAFQAWGNEPRNTPEKFINIISEHLSDPLHPDKAQRYDFHTWKFRRWAFSLATQPPIMVLDSRTQRDFGVNNQPPQLMDRYALDGLRAEWMQLKQSLVIQDSQTVTPIFITGTPVFGFSTIEWLQFMLYHLGVILGNIWLPFSASGLDVEGWIANRRGFSNFLDTLLFKLGLRSATFLSGDVHYSFVNRAIYSNRSNLCQAQSAHNSWQQSPSLECLQLTSSALRNTPDKRRYLESFFANWVIKHKHGHSAPELLPWWERWHVWRLFRYDTWKLRIEGIAGHSLQERALTGWQLPLFWRLIRFKRGKFSLIKNCYWLTSRPNIALVYLQQGKVTQQILLSGERLENKLIYKIR